MKNIIKFYLGIFIFISVFSVPLLSLAQAGDEDFQAGKSLVPCGNDKTEIVRDPTTGKETGGEIINDCDFNYFMTMINKVINFILLQLTVPIAAIAFAYAGFLLLFSGGEAGSRTKAKSIFLNVAIGLIFIAGCWLIINTILSILGYDGSWIGFEK